MYDNFNKIINMKNNNFLIGFAFLLISLIIVSCNNPSEKHLELENPKLIENRGRYHLLLINKDEKYPQELKNIKQGEMLKNIKARHFD